MPTHKPDILLIILDTLRRDRLSVYGYPQVTSPAFDALAAESTLFDRAISPAQWTVPAHASMFTGLYPTTHQLTQSHSRLSPGHATLAELLQMEGYYTAGFCNNPLVGVLDNDLQRGFHDFFNYAGAAPNRPLHTTRRGLRRALSRRWRRFARRVGNQFAHSDWLFRASLHPRFTPVWTRYINYKGHTQHSIDDLIAYIHSYRAAPRIRPLFSFLNLMGTHLPYHPPQDYLRKIAPEIARSKAAYQFMTRFNADAARWASPAQPPLNQDEHQIIDAFYKAEICHQDYHLGRLFHALRHSGALDDMVVIVAADHGEGHGDHHFFGHSFVVHQELVHVPLMIHAPQQGYPVGRIATNISTRRIFHTVLEMAGASTTFMSEDNPNADIHGLSLARSLNCQPDTEGGAAFAEAVPPHTLLSVIKHRNPAALQQLKLTETRRGVYHGHHKLMVVGDEIDALYNIQQDPAEEQNIYAEQGGMAAQLQTRLRQFVHSAEAHRPPPTDDITPSQQPSAEVLENLRALGYIE